MQKQEVTYEISQNEEVHNMVCELTVMMHEKLRYTRFISTREFEKLSTCHNLEELDKYIQLEQDIFAQLFGRYPKLKNQTNFTQTIPMEEKYYNLLKSIEEFTSVDYLRTFEKGNENKIIIGLKIEVKTDNDKQYIAGVELIFKNKIGTK